MLPGIHLAAFDLAAALREHEARPTYASADAYGQASAALESAALGLAALRIEATGERGSMGAGVLLRQLADVAMGDCWMDETDEVAVPESLTHFDGDHTLPFYGVRR